MTYVVTEKQLRAAIGAVPPAIKAKKLNQLEEHSKRYLTMCDLVAVSSGLFSDTIEVFSAKSATWVIHTQTQFSMTVSGFSKSVDTARTAPCGLYLLVAGFEESLRINGTLSAQENADGSLALKITVEELYFHCGKSIKRSEFWDPQHSPVEVAEDTVAESLADPGINAFIQQAQFLLIATQNEQGDSDLSPRGDPAGFARILDDKTVFIPERPGNKIADSLTNLLSDDRAAVLLISPGCNTVLTLQGTARLTTATELLAASAVQGKAPKLGIVLSVTSCQLQVNPELKKMDLWNKSKFGDRSLFPSLGRIVSDQLLATGKMPGKNSGLGRMLGKAAGSASELLIQADYKKNLY